MKRLNSLSLRKQANLFLAKIEPYIPANADLIYAIIARTAYDLINYKKIKYLKNKKQIEIIEKNYIEAYNFLSHDGYLTHYFEDYCDCIDLNPDWVRKEARKFELIN